MANKTPETATKPRRKNTGYTFTDEERAQIEAVQKDLADEFGLAVTFHQAVGNIVKRGIAAIQKP